MKCIGVFKWQRNKLEKKVYSTQFFLWHPYFKIKEKNVQREKLDSGLKKVYSKMASKCGRCRLCNKWFIADEKVVLNDGETYHSECLGSGGSSVMKSPEYRKIYIF